MIRVVSWNIELGRNITQATQEIATISELKSPDILLLQEMSEPASQQLAGELGFDYRYFGRAPHPETGLLFGSTILSPWPMGEASSHLLPHTPRVQKQPRSMTSAVVTVDGVPITVFSAHLETVLLRLARRVEQVEVLATTVEELGASRVIAGGDFNTASDRSVRLFDQTLGKAGLTRATKADEPTFYRFGRPFRLDHLYAKGLTVTASGVAAKATASDHFPIWATFDLD